MRIHHDRLEVRTRGKGLYEITDEVQSKLDQRGVQNGIVTVFVQHTSCSVVIMENADPTARSDWNSRVGVRASAARDRSGIA